MWRCRGHLAGRLRAGRRRRLGARRGRGRRRDGRGGRPCCTPGNNQHDHQGQPPAARRAAGVKQGVEGSSDRVSCQKSTVRWDRVYFRLAKRPNSKQPEGRVVTGRGLCYSPAGGPDQNVKHDKSPRKSGSTLSPSLVGGRRGDGGAAAGLCRDPDARRPPNRQRRADPGGVARWRGAHAGVPALHGARLAVEPSLARRSHRLAAQPALGGLRRAGGRADLCAGAAHTAGDGTDG